MRRFLFIFLTLFITSFISKVMATCVYQGSSSSLNNVWSSAQNQPIGPATLNILAQRFQPAGTILYDNTYTMSQLLNTSDNTVLIKCTTAADALGAGASLRLDDTYQFQSFTVNGETNFYTGYTTGSNNYDNVGYALYGVNSEGNQSKLNFADSDMYSNTQANFS